MIQNLWNKIKAWFLPREGEVVLAAVIILTALASFGLGRLSALGKNKFPVRIEAKNQSVAALSSQNPKTESAQNLFVASRNGQVYHFPWCAGAQRIKEENKIFFNSREEAEKAGLRPAANCEGL